MELFRLHVALPAGQAHTEALNELGEKEDLFLLLLQFIHPLKNRACIGREKRFSVKQRFRLLDFESGGVDLAGSLSIRPRHDDLFAHQGHLRNSCKLHLAFRGSNDRITHCPT